MNENHNEESAPPKNEAGEVLTPTACENTQTITDASRLFESFRERFGIPAVYALGKFVNGLTNPDAKPDEKISSEVAQKILLDKETTASFLEKAVAEYIVEQDAALIKNGGLKVYLDTLVERSDPIAAYKANFKAGMETGLVYLLAGALITPFLPNWPDYFKPNKDPSADVKNLAKPAVAIVEKFDPAAAVCTARGDSNSSFCQQAQKKACPDGLTCLTRDEILRAFITERYRATQQQIKKDTRPSTQMSLDQRSPKTFAP